MLRTSVLLLIGLFLVGCGGGTIPVAPPHNSGSSSGTGSSSGSSGTNNSGSGSSGSGASSSGTSSSGSSGSGSSSGSSGSSGVGSSGSGGSSPSSAPSGVVGPSSFTFSGYNWGTDGGTAPPVGNINGNVGTFDPKNVTVGSELVLGTHTNQERQRDPVRRVGGHQQADFHLRNIRVHIQGVGGFVRFRCRGLSVCHQLRNRNRYGAGGEQARCRGLYELARSVKLSGHPSFRIRPEQQSRLQNRVAAHLHRLVRGWPLVVHHTQAYPERSGILFVQYMGHEQLFLGRYGNDWTDAIHLRQQLQVHQVVQSGNGVI